MQPLRGLLVLFAAARAELRKAAAARVIATAERRGLMNKQERTLIR